MLEVVIYRLSQVADLVIICLVVTTLIQMIFYRVLKKDKIEEKDMKIYGLFMNMNALETIMLSLSVVKTITIIYGAVTVKENIIIYLIIAISSAAMLIYNLRGLIKEAINTLAPIIILYMIYTLNNYQLEVEANNKIINIVKILLSIFVSIYAIYILLSNIEDITEKNVKKVSKN